ncbi:MAG: hypothetical protein U5J99_10645 [Parvularculaceae bacterium]|nr:hypothetical protein [Parvularculaceae bacterium]
MTTGRDALHDIDRTIADARRQLARSTDAAATDARLIAALDQRQMEIYRRLAELRLVELKSDGANGGALGPVDRQAEALIARHDGALADTTAQRDSMARELERLEAERVSAEAAVEAAIAAHDRAAAATRARLETDSAWRAKADALENFNAMAVRAEQKLSLAREDRASKGAAYEADPLFQYLRERKFGTRDYRAFPLFAVLDNWVARIINYRDHRLNYERLLEIPERFGEHLERLKSQSEVTTAALEERERKALEADGVVGLRDAVSAARASVEAIDAAIGKAEATHKRLSEEGAAVAAGKAGPLAEARELIASALQRVAIPDLKVLAAESATPEDDQLVDSLVGVRRQRMEIEEARAAAAASLDRQARSLSDLEAVRRRFKSARFDSPYSDFSGRDIVAVLLSEFLRGAIGRDDLWRRIERGHRTRRRDWDNDLGGDDWRGGFGLPDNWGGGSAGSWGGRDWSGGPVIRPPSGARLPRPPRIPRMPSGGPVSRGGFRTTRKF